MVQAPGAEASTLTALLDLSGKVALVTGGSRGLGLQVAAALAEFGALVVLVARKPHDLDEAAAALRCIGLTADTIAADLAADGAPEVLVAEVIRRHGRIDVLVNGAGATWGAPAETYPADGWDKVMNLNVTSLFRLIQAVAVQAFLPADRGSIINIASVEGLRGHHPDMPGTIAYNAAKGAVVNLTRALAAEWGPRGIRVNAIAPGYFQSKMTAGTIERHGEYLRKQTPLGRLGGSDDVKGGALLLASDAGRHITGHILVIDSGAGVV